MQVVNYIRNIGFELPDGEVADHLIMSNVSFLSSKPLKFEGNILTGDFVSIWNGFDTQNTSLLSDTGQIKSGAPVKRCAILFASMRGMEPVFVAKNIELS